MTEKQEVLIRYLNRVIRSCKTHQQLGFAYKWADRVIRKECSNASGIIYVTYMQMYSRIEWQF